jgi:rhodanese-related sulfurtransferase
MATSVKQMLEAANAAVPKVTPEQAAEMIKADNTLILDVRDAPEVAASGKIAGALNVSRGMLEFRADPESPYHDKNFDKSKTVILHCASGGRSALAGKLLKDMVYEKVCPTSRIVAPFTTVTTGEPIISRACMIRTRR